MKKIRLLAALAILIIAMAFALSACGATPGGETPGGETPGGETPGGETPGGETPGGETPGGETPGGETPGGETPGDETPGGETSGSGDTPGGETPGSGETPGGETPGSGDTPGGETTGFEYETNRNNTATYIITSIGTATGVDIVIPASINGTPVSAIAQSAFSGCSGIKSIVIPDSITSIGSSAFRGCTSLESVTIGNGVESIGSNAFRGCTSLESISVSEQNPNYKSIDGNLYTKDEKTIVQYAIGKKATCFTPPNSVESIGAYAFENCTSLASVTIGDGVASIGDYAFYNCSSLESVTIGDDVASIGNRAFYGCTSLEEIYFNATAMSDLSSDNRVFYDAGKDGDGIKFIIGNNVTKIPAYIFYPYSYSFSTSYSPKITSVEFEAESVCKSIGSAAFQDCASLESVTIPDSVETIGDYAFYECTSLASATIGDGVTSIGDYAFNGCSSLNGVTIPDSVTSIGDYAFYECTSLASATIENGVKSIGSNAFYGCTSLESITIPNSIESVGSSAFRGCTRLESVTIGDDVASIGNRAFYGCTSLEEIYFNATAMSDLSSDNYVFYDAGKDGDGIKVIIGNNVTKIPARIFSPDLYSTLYSAKITSIEFEKGSVCESIGASAFNGCSSLRSITIPDSVTSIGNYAFYECRSLASATIGDGVKSIGSYTFYGCIRLTTVTIGDGATSIGNEAFYGCENLVSVTLGNRVSSIGSYAFLLCDKLVEVINKSSLNIKPGSSDYGDVGFNAKEVHKGTSKVVNVNNFLFYTYGGVNYLLAYAGNDTTLILPDNYYGQEYKIYEYAFSNLTNLKSIIIPNSVTSIGWYAFDDCRSIESVYYCGTENEWNNIGISRGNSNMENAARYYYSETQPTEPGNYWYYDNGVIKIWE